MPEEMVPVLIPTLNRFEHLKRCLESLKRNTHADRTKVYVYIDYPKTTEHQLGYEKTVRYLGGVNGFLDLVIVKREVNLGATGNLFQALEELFRKHEKIIISEDDNEFSPCFLDFINKGMVAYEGNDSVFAVCGYGRPLRIECEVGGTAYMAPLFSAWGVGVWKMKWLKIPLTIESCKKELMNPIGLLGSGPLTLFNMENMMHMIKKRTVHSDVIIGHQLRKMGWASIFPVVSLVRNHGNDGSGQNCVSLMNDTYSMQAILSAESVDIVLCNEKENRKILDEIYLSLRLSFFHAFHIIVRYVLFIVDIAIH